MVPFAGYQMPLQYSSIQEEHQTVRTAVGIFDVSHMGEIFISGRDSEKFLQNLLTNNVTKLRSMRCHYTLMCNESGGIIDDMLLYRLAENKFMLVVNAANHQKDWNWINSHIEGDIILDDRSDDISLLALQGPKANEVLRKIFSHWEMLQKNHIRQLEYFGKTITVAATGYTGEDGVEIYCPNEIAGSLWEQILDMGEECNISPIGLGARDTLRMEMGFCLYGNDINETTSPLNSGLGWVVKMKKGDFIGKSGMLETPSEHTLIGLLPTEKTIPRTDCPIFFDGNHVGEVTSGGFSPSLEQGIAIARLQKEVAQEGNLVEIEIRGQRKPAMVVRFPIYKP